MSILAEYERVSALANSAEVRMKCPPATLRAYCEKIQEKFNKRGGKAKLVTETSSQAAEIGVVTRDEFIKALSNAKNAKLLTSHGLRHFLANLVVENEKLSKFRSGFGNANFATSISEVTSATSMTELDK